MKITSKMIAVFFIFLLINTPASLALPQDCGINRVSTNEKVIALTFDAHYEAVPYYGRAEILNILAANNLKCTFFLSGKFIEEQPALVEAILADGHEVGNHTYSHAYISPERENKERLTTELLRTKAIFSQKMGREMSPYWRAPYGNLNKEIETWGLAAGFHHIGWSVDMLDWVERNDKRYLPAAGLLRRFKEKLDLPDAPGGIFLCHYGTKRAEENLAGVLQQMIDHAKERGFRIVSISELMKAAQPQPTKDKPLK